MLDTFDSLESMVESRCFVEHGLVVQKTASVDWGVVRIALEATRKEFFDVVERLRGGDTRALSTLGSMAGSVAAARDAEALAWLRAALLWLTSEVEAETVGDLGLVDAVLGGAERELDASRAQAMRSTDRRILKEGVLRLLRESDRRWRPGEIAAACGTELSQVSRVLRSLQASGDVTAVDSPGLEAPGDERAIWYVANRRTED